MAKSVSLESCLPSQRNAGSMAQAHNLFDLSKLQSMDHACSMTLPLCSQEACLTSALVKPSMGLSVESSMALCSRKLLMVVGSRLGSYSELYVPDPGHGRGSA